MLAFYGIGLFELLIVGAMLVIPAAVLAVLVAAAIKILRAKHLD